MPEMRVNGSRLHGPDVQITVSTLLDGGTWLRPLRGDMIRLPVPDTQVRKDSNHRGRIHLFPHRLRLACPIDLFHIGKTPLDSQNS